MPFNPQELTPGTVKGFVDRLHRYAKETTAENWPPKRAWSQEAIARALGFPNYHALHLACEAQRLQPASPWHWLFTSPSGRAFWRISPEWNVYRSSESGLSLPKDKWLDPVLIQGEERERKLLFSSLSEQARHHRLPVLWVQGPWALPAPPALEVEVVRNTFDLGSIINLLLAKKSAGDLIEIFMGLAWGSPEEKESMWRGRAEAMLGSLIAALVFLRDHEGLLLTIGSFQEHLSLDGFIELSKNMALPAHILQSLRAYLYSVPGYQEKSKEQSETVMDQHGYIHMSFTRVVGASGAPQRFLNFSPQQSLTLSETTDPSILLPGLVEEWAEENPGGVLLLDGLSGKSALLEWLPRAIPRMVDQGIRIALGARYLNDWALVAGRMQPLLSRFPHALIMDGAADDPWFSHGPSAGWMTSRSGD